VKLVERALNADSRLSLRERASEQYLSGSEPASAHAASEHALSRSERRLSDAARESIEALVEAVHGHARTLALLAPELRSRGVEATRETLVELMAAMERQFPGSREQSLFASVELSLRRMSAANRDRARVLGVFHGGVKMEILGMMMQWQESDVVPLAVELVATGLATSNRYNHRRARSGNWGTSIATSADARKRQWRSFAKLLTNTLNFTISQTKGVADLILPCV
jgi:hypothetical protein